MDGFPTVATFRLIHFLLGNNIHSPEGEEDMGFNAAHPGSIPQNQGRVSHIQGAFGGNNGQLADIFFDDIGIRSHHSGFLFSVLDAASRFL